MVYEVYNLFVGPANIVIWEFDWYGDGRNQIDKIFTLLKVPTLYTPIRNI